MVPKAPASGVDGTAGVVFPKPFLPPLSPSVFTRDHNPMCGWRYECQPLISTGTRACDSVTMGRSTRNADALIENLDALVQKKKIVFFNNFLFSHFLKWNNISQWFLILVDGAAGVDCFLLSERGKMVSRYQDFHAGAQRGK